jgi:AcrR family transcriptional regulator
MAGISRAAFYLHFPNKDAMLDVLQEEMGDWYLRQYKKLDAKTAASKAGVVEWLRNFVRGFGAAKHAIVLVTRQENGRERLRSQAVRRRGEAVLALGAQVPAFRLVGEDGRIDEERRIRLLLLIFQVEQLCQYLVFDAPSEGDFPLEVLAEEFVRFGGASAAQDATTMEGR